MFEVNERMQEKKNYNLPLIRILFFNNHNQPFLLFPIFFCDKTKLCKK